MEPENQKPEVKEQVVEEDVEQSEEVGHSFELDVVVVPEPEMTA